MDLEKQLRKEREIEAAKHHQFLLDLEANRLAEAERRQASYDSELELAKGADAMVAEQERIKTGLQPGERMMRVEDDDGFGRKIIRWARGFFPEPSDETTKTIDHTR